MIGIRKIGLNAASMGFSAEYQAVYDSFLTDAIEVYMDSNGKGVIT